MNAQSIDREIPFVELKPQSTASFYMRPLLRTVDPVALQEGPHRHSFQELLWVHQGSGEHRIDETVLPIVPNTFYLIAQGQVHYFTEGLELDGYLIRFTDDFLLDEQAAHAWDYRLTLFNHFAIHHHIPIDIEQVDSINQIVHWMWREHRQAGFGQEQLLRHLLNALLIQLERARQGMVIKDQDLSYSAQIFQSFMSHLESHHRAEHHVRFYAETLFVTPRQLSDITRKYAGKTAKQLIQDRVMLEAKRYLQHTNVSIKEIAFALGFQEASYFSKVFKHHVGMSPQAYKAGSDCMSKVTG